MPNNIVSDQNHWDKIVQRPFATFLFAGCVVLIALLFIDIGGPTPSLIFGQITNAGHIVLFYLLTSLWLHFQNPLKPKDTLTTLIYALLSGTLIGLAFELIQLLFGRDFSFFDLLRNACGILLALAFSLKAPLLQNRKRLKIVRVLTILLTIFILYPLWIAFTDSIISHYQYPILSNFETPFEKNRWSSNTKTRVIRNATSKALEVTMWPRKGYNKLNLDYFYSDWSDSEALKLDIYNTSSESRKINIRIHDKQHLQSRQLFSDRYNKKIELHPGWNFISIPVKDLKNAPLKRHINLSAIMNLQLFTKGLGKKWVIWVDNVQLHK